MISQLRELLYRCVEDPDAEKQLVSFSNQLTQLNDDQIRSMLSLLVEFAGTTEGQVWPRMAAACLGGLANSRKSPSPGWSDDTIQYLEKLYRSCPPNHALRNQILALLANVDARRPLQTWCQLVCEDPPLDRLTIGMAFAPLMRERRKPPQELLDQLVSDATKHVSVAAAVFDYLNYSVRTHKISPHPASRRSAELRVLLGELVGQMSKIEEGNLPTESDATRIAQIIGDSVALIVALCNSFAIMNDHQAIGKLKQAVKLRHRRIQTEAAAALAVLGDPEGKQILIRLAEEPISRLRVLAYAQELDIENEISLEHRGEIATAESHLAMWLAKPAQMGMAPTTMELLDHRELSWPSYQQPMSCYLFRYYYGSGDDAYRNVGISGPLTHAFTSDIQHLSIGDMYAAFAGWQTVHAELFIVPIERAEKIIGSQVRKLRSALAEYDYSDTQPVAIASFFGEYVLVAHAQRDNETGTVIVDQRNDDWIASGSPTAPIDWKLALDIWQGRKLLANFNPVQRF